MNKNKNKKQNRKPPILCMYACIYVYKINIRVKKFYGTALGLRNPRQSSILDNSNKIKKVNTYIGTREGAGPATVARRGNGRFRHLKKEKR